MENHIGLAVSEILRHKQKKLTTLYNRIKYLLHDMEIFVLFNHHNAVKKS